MYQYIGGEILEMVTCSDSAVPFETSSAHLTSADISLHTRCYCTLYGFLGARPQHPAPRARGPGSPGAVDSPTTEDSRRAWSSASPYSYKPTVKLNKSYPGHNLRKIVNHRKLLHNIAQYREISRTRQPGPGPRATCCAVPRAKVR